MVAVRVRRPGSTPKLVRTWTGPLQNVTADKMHVYGVQNIFTGEFKDVQVVRLRFYVDKDLEMTAALKKVFQHAFTQGEFEMAGIVDTSEAKEGQGFDVKVDWVRFDEGENSWESLAIIWDGALQLIKSELRRLRLNRGVRSRLQTFYGITLQLIGAYTSLSSSSGLRFNSNEPLGVLWSRAHVVNGKIRACYRGFLDPVVACVNQV